ncbi:MAG: hypothetical protein ABL903_13825 [Methylococcales bacterium]
MGNDGENQNGAIAGCLFFGDQNQLVITVGLWTQDQLLEKQGIDRYFRGTFAPDEIRSRKHYWFKAVARAKNWLD